MTWDHTTNLLRLLGTNSDHFVYRATLAMAGVSQHVEPAISSSSWVGKWKTVPRIASSNTDMLLGTRQVVRIGADLRAAVHPPRRASSLWVPAVTGRSVTQQQ